MVFRFSEFPGVSIGHTPVAVDCKPVAAWAIFPAARRVALSPVFAAASNMGELSRTASLAKGTALHAGVLGVGEGEASVGLADGPAALRAA
jgi:hypothetical protein